MKQVDIDTELIDERNILLISSVDKNVSFNLVRAYEEDNFSEFITLDVVTKKFSALISLPTSVTIDNLIDALTNLKEQYSKIEDV
jgi:hypothetical protein